VAGYLLDTSVLSAYLNPDHKHHGNTVHVVDGLPLNDPKFVSVITLAEFDFGIRLAELAGSTRLVEYRDRLSIVRKYASLPLTHHTSEAYAELKALLASKVQRPRKGKMRRWIEDWIDMGSGKRLQIDENDLWICAQAKERDLIVLTADDDIRHLTSIDADLRVLFARQ
jgi:predicted nucleic acid-binding protein